jgi:hypothetical protein
MFMIESNDRVNELNASFNEATALLNAVSGQDTAVNARVNELNGSFNEADGPVNELNGSYNEANKSFKTVNGPVNVPRLRETLPE